MDPMHSYPHNASTLGVYVLQDDVQDCNACWGCSALPFEYMSIFQIIIGNVLLLNYACFWLDQQASKILLKINKNT